MASAQVEWSGVSYVAIPIVLELVLSYSLNLGLHVSLFIAAARCVIQLSLLAAVLNFVLTKDSPWLTLGLSLFMMAFGSVELTFLRLARRPSGFLWKAFLCLSVSVYPLTLFTAYLCMASETPWSAATFIPVFGMLAGNTIASSAVAVTCIIKEVIDNSDRVEWKLAYGATRFEACLSVIREAMQLALLPAITSMAVTGVVVIPGAMSGAILGGADANKASRIQMIMLILISCTSFGCVCLVVLATCMTIMDDSPRIRPDRVHKKAGISLWFKRSADPKLPEEEAGVAPINGVAPLADDRDTSKTSALSVRRLTAPLLVDHDAPLWRNVAFDVEKGDILMLRGPSGCGKSLLMRTVALFYAPHHSTTALSETYGVSPAQCQGGVPEWRSRVLYVAQRPSSLAITPIATVKQISAFRNARLSHNATALGALGEMQSLAASWQVRTECWQQPWNTLSGGEGQRIALAIALCASPDVLLLDEPTSALDQAATMAVEESIRQFAARGGAVVCISHSEEQATRLGGKTCWLGTAHS